MALDRSEDWRKGNPNWKKGVPHPSKGRPVGYRNKLNRTTKSMLVKLDRHPIEELIALADMAKKEKDYKWAAEIWREIHAESTANQTLEDTEGEAKQKRKLIDELSEENGPNTGTKTSGNPPSMDRRGPSVPPETRPAGDAPKPPVEPGVDLRSELLTATGEINDAGHVRAGNSDKEPESPHPLRGPDEGRPS